MVVMKAKKWLFIRQKYELVYAWLLHMNISIYQGTHLEISTVMKFKLYIYDPIFNDWM